MTELSVRHSELLFLLAQHPKGYTADQLAIALHERDVPAVTVRAELSRLRSQLPELALTGRPYRIAATVHTDVAAVRASAGHGRCRRRGAVPIPARSCRHRNRRRCRPSETCCTARSAPPYCVPTDPAAVLAFANGPSSREDALVWRHAVELADPATRPVLLEQLRRIEREFGA